MSLSGEEREQQDGGDAERERELAAELIAAEEGDRGLHGGLRTKLERRYDAGGTRIGRPVDRGVPNRHS